MAPLLDTLGADAYRVGGSGASEQQLPSEVAAAEARMTVTALE